MELSKKTYQLTLAYSVTVNDEPILHPKTKTTVTENGTSHDEDTKLVRELLLALLHGDKTILHNMILQKIAYQMAPSEGEQVFEAITGDSIDVLNEQLVNQTIESLQGEAREYYYGDKDGFGLVLALQDAFTTELEHVDFREVQTVHVHDQAPEKKRHHKQKPKRK